MSSKYPILDQQTRYSLRHTLKQADPIIFDDAINFLVEDPRTFGSGYIKELIWRYIRRYNLTDNHIVRLEQAALKYLDRPMSREFKYMCLTISQIASRDFWESIKSRLDTDNPRVQVNAYCLFAYSSGLNAGEKERLSLQKMKALYSSWNYSRYPQVNSLKEFLLMVTDSVNWQDEKVIYQSSRGNDLPVIYYYDDDPYHQYYEQWLVSLDMRYCYPETLLPMLKEILSTGDLNIFTVEIWLYVLYLLEKINHPSVVPILINFLEQKVDYKLFESVKKWMILQASFRVLRKHDSLAAREAIQKRQAEDSSFTNHLYSLPNALGWLFN